MPTLLLGFGNSARQNNRITLNEDFRHLLEPGVKLWIEKDRQRTNAIVSWSMCNTISVYYLESTNKNQSTMEIYR